MKLIFATGNRGKLQEAADILGEGFELVTPAEMGITEDIPETGLTLKENSLQKAMYIHEKTGMDCFADDTGLEVDCLDGAPGIYSARYAGPGHDFDANVAKLLADIEAKGPEASRKACFRCVVTLIWKGRTIFFEGRMDGNIAPKRSGTRGFGYDPVFIPDQHPGLTLSDVSEEAKNEISHRGQSLRAMAAWLAEHK